ncbi:hypothetical protein BEWA_021060 [Theileria equi strain WA]|uniref:Uncharacterized protein n=1 Tax=Theileria equi strain WA TaxID=1537102 RepID=L0AWH0_THEEQ|nr:hypothetical protein BEWA_021060 [Theileria equi strain WA]AFZ79259.1 hypothetical protein BEWA_021060 [Theileria equi strain WA]|eukprot:XP_004828925.1 hypothetical protein BEWA_021060 [Theileria equi strain WA]
MLFRWLRKGDNSIFYIRRNFLHHSPNSGRYFTNRLYMKKCSSCTSWNHLSAIHCSKCSHKLTDDDIRLRTIDPIYEISNVQKSSIVKEQYSSKVLYRCFDFTIMYHPQPSGLIHLSATPNGTFYDIKNFRRAHIPLISKMKQTCINVFKEIITETPVSEGDTHLSRIKSFIKDDNKEKHWNFVSSLLIFGFNYPSNFVHVVMHAILPPIHTFNMFKCPYYYPLETVLADLESYGRVHSFTPAFMRKLNENDTIFKDIVTTNDTFKKTILGEEPQE